MSYLVLARKYRPMFFKDVVGQEHVTRTLQNAIEQDRIANAYLFTGPRGVGKTTVARILAKALNCDDGPTINPCNRCSSCIEVNESRSLDVLEIDGASNRGIDEVRNLRESLRYSPHPGKYRIHIIDEVHMLTNEAFNALLKTLEEPPSRVLFIFATTEPHKVPATILSRCQRFDFKRITSRAIMEMLTELCKKEEITIDDESLRLIANKGDGSMRDAESILDQIIAFGGNTIHSDDTVALLGIIGQELFFKVTDLIKMNDVQGGIELVQQIFSEGYDFNEFLLGLAEHLRNFMVVKSTGNVNELNVSEESAKKYLAEMDDFLMEDLLRLVKIASDAENLLRRSANARLHLEVALIKMIKLTKSVQLSDLLAQLQEAKKKSNLGTLSPSRAMPQPKATLPANHLSSPPVFSQERGQGAVLPPRAAASASRAENGSTPLFVDNNGESDSAKRPMSLAEVEKKWPLVVERVKNRKIGLGSLLTEGWPTRVQGVALELSFDGKNGFHIASVERQAAIIEEVIEEVMEIRLKLCCVRTDKNKLEQLRKIDAPIDKKKEFDKLLQESELFKEIVDKFDAEFIK
jgi:DNA polymerase-3 subunit gamma/tau